MLLIFENYPFLRVVHIELQSPRSQQLRLLLFGIKRENLYLCLGYLISFFNLHWLCKQKLSCLTFADFCTMRASH